MEPDKIELPPPPLMVDRLELAEIELTKPPLMVVCQRWPE